MSVKVETYCYKCDEPIDIDMLYDGEESVIFCRNCGFAIRYRLGVNIEMENALKIGEK